YHKVSSLMTLSVVIVSYAFFFFSSRRRHTRSKRDWSSDVCSSDLAAAHLLAREMEAGGDLTEAVRRIASVRSPPASLDGAFTLRSEERRVGKEFCSERTPAHIKEESTLAA